MKKPSNKSRVLVCIPAYCCEVQIVRVIAQFDQTTQGHFDTVMVIDNRSSDDTVRCAVEKGKMQFNKCSFIVQVNDENYGLGGSHKVAFRYAIENGFHYLVILHGDDQADIRDVTPLLEQGVHQDVDCLLGARFMRGSRLAGYSWFRTFGNRVYNMLFSIVAANRIFDLGSGLNVYRLSAYRDFHYKSYPDDLTFNYVMLLASYHLKQAIRYFPISWREEDQASNVRLFRQAFKVLGLLGGYFAGRGAFLARDLRTRKHDSYTSSIVYQHHQPENTPG